MSDWLGNSIDLNPVENLWSIVKQQLKKHDCTSMEKLICTVIQIYYESEECGNMVLKLPEIMPKRVQMVIKRTGRYIKY